MEIKTNYLREQERNLRTSRIKKISLTALLLSLLGGCVYFSRDNKPKLKNFPTRTIQVEIPAERGYNSATRQAIKQEPELDKYDFEELRYQIIKLNKHKILRAGNNNLIIPDLP